VREGRKDIRRNLCNVRSAECIDVRRKEVWVWQWMSEGIDRRKNQCHVASHECINVRVYMARIMWK
jgi:hypothetical protein